MPTHRWPCIQGPRPQPCSASLNHAPYRRASREPSLPGLPTSVLLPGRFSLVRFQEEVICLDSSNRVSRGGRDRAVIGSDVRASSGQTLRRQLATSCLTSAGWVHWPQTSLALALLLLPPQAATLSTPTAQPCTPARLCAARWQWNMTSSSSLDASTWWPRPVSCKPRANAGRAPWSGLTAGFCTPLQVVLPRG